MCLPGRSNGFEQFPFAERFRRHAEITGVQQSSLRICDALRHLPTSLNVCLGPVAALQA
jgi:hypothetical protein